MPASRLLRRNGQNATTKTVAFIGARLVESCAAMIGEHSVRGRVREGERSSVPTFGIQRRRRHIKIARLRKAYVAAAYQTFPTSRLSKIAASWKG